MNNQTLDICYIGQQRENLQTVNKLKSLFVSTLNLEWEDPPMLQYAGQNTLGGIG